jgi:UDP-N-acetylmuramate--alanine ligase
VTEHVDLSAARSVHVVGAGGAGMSAIAIVLAEMGHRVSGSDLRPSRYLDRVALAGAGVHVGHAAEHLPPNVDVVVTSTAVRTQNPEIEAARDRGVPVLSRAAMLASIAATKQAIAVAGTHGKTTTSSMLTLVLREAGWHPSFIVGGELNEVGTNAAWDFGDWLVVEADESDGTFLEIPAAAAVVTSLEPDHLDHYGDVASLVAAFERFVDGCRGPVAIGVDDDARALVARRSGAAGYGFAPEARYRIERYTGDRAGCRFDLVVDAETVAEIELPVAGRHNAANAAGAAAIALELGVPAPATVAALAGFGGVARRFQLRGERDGVTFVDDYAHLPGEVRAAIAAAREGGWRRLVVVFQPHRYTRTAALGPQFGAAFAGADTVVVTDVYAAGEQPIPGVSGHVVADAVRAALGSAAEVVYSPRREDLRDLPRRLAGPGDLVLTLGAGDLTSLPDEWLQEGGS